MKRSIFHLALDKMAHLLGVALLAAVHQWRNTFHRGPGRPRRTNPAHGVHRRAESWKTNKPISLMDRNSKATPPQPSGELVDNQTRSGQQLLVLGSYNYRGGSIKSKTRSIIFRVSFFIWLCIVFPRESRLLAVDNNCATTNSRRNSRVVRKRPVPG